MRRAVFSLALGLCALTGSAEAGSSLPSSIPGITIGNSHVVLRGNGKGTLVRGSAPTGKVAELTKLRVTDVVIFKNATGQEVVTELAQLRQAGYRAASISHIPFAWKDLPPFRTSCGQVVDALATLDRVYHTPGRTAFFHCTVGEDRTGLLAGLVRLLETGETVAQVFQRELCARGYEAGNPHKPPMVVNQVRAGLTPLFLKMATLIKAGKLKPGALSKTVCARDPGMGSLNPASFLCPR